MRSQSDPRIFRWTAMALAVCVAMTTAGIATPSRAEEKRVPASRAEISLSFAPVVKKVAPAVVSIYTKRVVATQPVSPFFNDPFFRRFFGRDFGGLPKKRVQGALGSGVIVKPDGVIVTNSHVIRGADQITVVTTDRNEYEAQVLLRDDRTDLAVLRIKADHPLPALQLRDADELEVGDIVLAVGNPFGVGQTVTSGIVSAIARTNVGIADFRSFIQTDAAINPGNSGGALVTLDGRLVGINTAIFSKSGGSVGIGFAIPSNMVNAVLHSALTGKPLVRPWLGVDGQNVTPDIANSIGLKRIAGVIVNKIDKRGSADEAGLKSGDVIIAINDKPVDDAQALRYRLALLQVGSTAKLSVIREGKERELEVKLVAPPEDPPRNTTTITGYSPFGGATVANLSPRLADELGTGALDKGVIITAVAEGSPAYRLRMTKGDLILNVNGKAIKRVNDLKEAVAQPSDSWYLQIKRRGQVITLRLRG
jgi:Do/DeqQ family serine protease